MGLNMKNAVLLAKAEVTPGVDAVPDGATNAMLVQNLSINPLEQEVVQRNLIRPYFGNDEQIPVGTKLSLSFEVEAAGSGVAGTAPAYADLLKACGTSENITVGTDVRYRPLSGDFGSLTMIYNLDGVSHKCTYARGSVELMFDAKGLPKFKFSFVALYADVVDATVLAVDYSAFIKPLAVNKRNTPTASLHSNNIVLQSLSMDVGMNSVYQNLVGYEGVDLTDRATRGKILFQYTKVATYDWFAAIKNGDSGALSFVHGVTAGNIVELAAPNVQIVNPSISDQDGTAMLGLDLNYNPDVGNDEFEIIIR